MGGFSRVRGLLALWGVLLLGLSCGGDTGAVRQVRLHLDEQPPTWPYGSSIAITLRTPTRVRIEWPEATDNEGVTRYRVERDGVPVADLRPTERSYTDTGLTPSQSVQYSVHAEDATPNRTTLNVGTTTQAPSQPPTWQSMTPALNLVDIGKRRVMLQWTPASDDYEELSYEVRARTSSTDTILLCVVDPAVSPTECVSPAVLNPSTAYTFEVTASDAEGQSITLTTTGTTRALSDPPMWASGSSLDLQREGWGTVTASTTAHGGLDVEQYNCIYRLTAGAWESCGQVTVHGPLGDVRSLPG